ncbi:Tn3 family transposase [Streptomyces sp. NPDC001586]|uniref:Tn3 family transposase n=1 Tax=Streptomyces sp. NPDC001586 TaxID=3154387 RepID=UPI00331C34D5
MRRRRLGAGRGEEALGEDRIGAWRLRQLGALGLVLNAIVLWTARYIDAAVARLRAEGHEILEEGIARLSPLKHCNLDVLGRSPPAVGTLCPLRPGHRRARRRGRARDGVPVRTVSPAANPPGHAVASLGSATGGATGCGA